jgi:hypothetical protein
MSNRTLKKINFYLILLLAVSLINCANQLPPGGGEIDLIPPEIVHVSPANETTNFTNNYFELRFSEYVEKRSVREAIFISPAIDGNLELDWSGRSVRVYFPHSLRENTTYVVTIGTDVVDLNNRNRMAEAFTFVFSTGPEIHTKMITGRVYDPNPGEVMIFAYQIAEDTINPFLHKADFISQAGTEGNFRLMGLSEGTYRVFAVDDQYRDLVINIGQDRFGAPFQDVVLAADDSLFSNLNFFLTAIDTIPPRISGASMTDRNHLLLNLSEPFDSTIIRSGNFYFYDSTANLRVDPIFAFKGNTRETELVLVVDHNFPIENNVYIFADTLRDKLNNIFLNDFTLINVSDRADTTVPSIFRMIPPPRADNVDFISPAFRFFFDDAFDSSTAKNNISFTDTLMNKISFSINFIDDASFVITSLQQLEPRKDYLINLDLRNFTDAAGNSGDTIFTYRFRTITGLDFTGVSGTLINADAAKNPLLVLERREQPFNIYRQYAADNLSFNFERVEPGSYRLWAFYDEDSSRNYKHGYPYPFQPSEEFYFYPDSLQLRARWTQTDIKFVFPAR